MLQIRDVFLGQTTCCSCGHVDRPGDATNLVETSCYLFGRNSCTLKTVVKVSRNTELYSCQTTHLKPQNSYQFSKSVRD